VGVGESSNGWLEDSGLISETAFSHGFSSTWKVLAPATDLFVRKLNAALRQREFVPLKSSVPPDRRAFINEVAFQLFRLRSLGSELSAGNDNLILAATESSRLTISRIERIPLTDIAGPTDDERTDVVAQLDRLLFFFRGVSRDTGLEVAPRFPGCGIIDACVGDVRCGETLYEIKAGDRNFRSVDVRQLLVYAALNKSADGPSLRQIGLFNPRTGLSFCMNLDDVCLEVSGTTSEELLTELIRVFSSGETSR
jgi:hypothetical protein